MKRLILIGGLPGVGKSTFAKFIVQQIKLKFKDAIVLSYNTDLIRKIIFADSKRSKSDFTKNELTSVYGSIAVLVKAFGDIETKQNYFVIIDGAFRLKKYRNLIFKNSKKFTQINFYEINCSEKLLINRLNKRLEKGKGVGSRVYYKVLKEYEKFGRKHKSQNVNYTKIDNSNSIQELLTASKKLI